jgi:hypothetical protein
MADELFPVPLREKSEPLVRRSSVPPAASYGQYRQVLRRDFYYSCAYCGTTEAEAWAVRMTIDHYEPRHARPDLENNYSNLMYCCDECNIRKGDRCPPAQARDAGYRFFRPDEDVHEAHFTPSGVRVDAASNTGYYTIHALDLNRQALRRVRELRERLCESDRFVAHGIAALATLALDKLKPELRARVMKDVETIKTKENAQAGYIDDSLARFARSPLLDSDDEVEARAKDRGAQLSVLKQIFPGSWRAPRPKARKRSSRSSRKPR